MIAAGGEHRFGVELRLRSCPAPARHQPAGAVPQHGDGSIGHRPHHPAGHRGSIHPELGVNAGHHDVQPGQQCRILIQRAVLEDVHLDPGQDAKRCESLAQLVDNVQLMRESLGGKAVGDGEPWGVVGQRAVLVAEGGRGGHHLFDRRGAVRPVRVAVQVAAQCGSYVASAEIVCIATQLDQCIGFTPGPRLGDHGGGLGSDTGQGLPAPRAAVPLEGFGVEFGDDVGGPAVGHHPPRFLTGAVLVEGDLPQRRHRVHHLSVRGARG